MAFETKTEELLTAFDANGNVVTHGDVVCLDVSKIMLSLPQLDMAMGLKYRVIETFPCDLLSNRQLHVTQRHEGVAVKLAVISQDLVATTGGSAVAAPFRCWVPSEAVKRMSDEVSCSNLVAGRDYAMTAVEQAAG